MVRLVDGTGGGGSVKTIAQDARTYVPFIPGWDIVVDNLAAVPVVALALGSVAGLGAARVVSSHYSLMVKGTAQVFVAGPPVVARLGERVDKEELGGSHIHARNGVVDDEVDAEDEAFARTRRFLSYLPSAVDRVAERTSTDDDADRREEWLIGAIPRNRRTPYAIRPIIDALVDRGSFFEIGRLWGRSAVTGLARLDGWPVAVLAGDPMFYGAGWTADASDKVTRIVDLADTFHLPVVHLVDQPGFVIGAAAERAATIRRGARALAAVYQAEVPWCSVILRRVFGVAGAGHANHARFHYRYAWPSGDWGSLPLEGGVEAAYRAELDAAASPEEREALLAELTARLDRCPVAAAHGRGLSRRRAHRSTRHPSAAVRVRPPGRPLAPPRTPGDRLPPVRDEAAALIAESDVIDLHVESFIWTRLFGYQIGRAHDRTPLGDRYFGHADLPRARAAGLTGLVMSIATNPFRSVCGRRTAVERNLAQLRRTLAGNGAAVVADVAGYRRARADGRLACFLALQGGNALQAEDLTHPGLDDVSRITLVHLTRSRLGVDQRAGRRRPGGLTAEGRRFVEAMADRSIVLDLAHASPRTFWDALDVYPADRPVIVSHTGAAAQQPSWRNVDDDQIRAVADRGGVVGIMFHRGFLARPARRAGAADVARHLAHVVRVGGAGCAAIGSDFDGMIVPPPDLADVLALPRLVGALLDRGVAPEAVRQMLGANYLRVLGAIRGGG